MSAPVKPTGSRLPLIVVIVVVAALGVVFFQAQRRVTASGEDKNVLSQLRQLSAAADQYYEEHGVSVVGINELVGLDKYVKVVHPHAGEAYPTQFTKGVTLTATGVAGARTVTYAP